MSWVPARQQKAALRAHSLTLFLQQQQQVDGARIRRPRRSEEFSCKLCIQTLQMGEEEGSSEGQEGMRQETSRSCSITPVGLTFPLQGGTEQEETATPPVGSLTLFAQPETRRAKQGRKH